ncbi:MAG: hypothetical protein B6I30_01990 [Desulfobacteraceae bacterium 4572_187]|nr:MAG: hypothetical protein B6I30_01990 [Desulfobacteraceae bacterium 4572_187]
MDIDFFKNDTKTSDGFFVDLCYECFLGRKSDIEGRRNAVAALKHGMSRLDFIKSLVSSSEYYTKLVAILQVGAKLPNLRDMQPERYKWSKNCYNDDKTLVLYVKNSIDYDWVETMIIENGYYETGGVWSFAIDVDKHLIAEIVSRFNVSCFLEIGCSTGSVLKLLDEKKIYGEGTEISHSALANCYQSIRQRIHYGDILKLNLDSKYDLILGMDVFEHLNPNKIASYVERCYNLLSDSGFIFANIPSFGEDPIFGEIFPIYLEDWVHESEFSGLFSLLPVDEYGWPLHGHLIWATTSWWQKVFENSGFKREEEIEKALHGIYDTFMKQNAPARMSFYVFSKNLNGSTHLENIVNSIKLNYSDFTKL